MTRAEYIENLEKSLEKVLQDTKFNNNKNQLAAWKLSAQFNRNYSEDFLWNRALFLSSNGAQVMLHGNNERLAIRALRESALIYENFYHASEQFDKKFSLVLSSLCFDIAGYQANAVCLIRKLDSYEMEATEDDTDLSADNYILEHINLLLRKNIPMAENTISVEIQNDFGISYFNNAISKWYSEILRSTETNFTEDLKGAYRYFLNQSNITISQLLLLLSARAKSYLERSIWRNLSQIDGLRDNVIWKKYVRLLATDIYDGRAIRSLDKRLSKFEFWTSQLRAIQKGLLSTDQSFVIQMPTSAGKTFVAELSILKSLVDFPNRKCLYISPFRALAVEKETDLSDNLSKLGYLVSALSGSYEVDEFQDIVLSETDVLIATPEKIDLLLRMNPDYFDEVSLAVIDEGHILGDISPRSSLLEFLLIRLKMKVPELKTLFISAVMPIENANQYAVWLSGSPENVIRSTLYNDSPPTEEWEPTRKLLGSFTWEGVNGRISYKDISTEDEDTKVVTPSFIPSIIKRNQYAGLFPTGTNKSQTSAALGYRLAQDGNTLIFCAQVRETGSVGNALLAILTALRATDAEMPDWCIVDANRESYFFARKWYDANHYIPLCLSNGIGVHFGDMPESVRRSVEEDFVKGNLRMLISTNTIGQGLNFPIKNLVIHSTIIGFANGGIRRVEVRDFWNIIGRAGRAGRETEGQIIFNIATTPDRIAYNKYIDKENIAPANSLFYNVLDSLMVGRISRAIFESNISVLSEPYILSLITEEIMGTEDQEAIEGILNNSLFLVQCKAKGYELEPIVTSFKRIFHQIREDHPINKIQAFAETGLCLESNSKMDTFIVEQLEAIDDLIYADDYFGLLKLIYQLFDTVTLDEIKSDKLVRIELDYSEMFDVTISWVSGNEVSEIQEQWIAKGEDIGHLNNLIADGFYYRIPWLISSFQTLLLPHLAISREDIPLGIANLASYVKYGVNNPTACLLRSMGIKNRDVCFKMAETSNYLTGRPLIRWVSNLISKDLDLMEIGSFDKKNIFSVSMKLRPQKYFETPNAFEFMLKGTSADEEMKFTSTVIEVGETLTFKREFNNEFDPFAILLYFGESKVGYIPREFSKIISVEIDINEINYEILVTDVVENGDFNEINVQMQAIE